MKLYWIFIPVFVQVALVFVLYIRLSIVKKKAAREGRVNEERRALHADAWPDDVLKVSNNIRNQFESPILFYVLTLILWALKAVNVYTLSIACLYVVSRIVHSFLHTGSNIVPLRRRAFIVGILSLVALLGFAVKTIVMMG